MARGKSITKELVEETAIQMAMENGIDNVAYNQLARELGIRPQSLYRYVANIQEVRIIIIRKFLTEMCDILSDSLQNRSAVDALRTFSSTLYDISQQSPWYYESLDLMHKYDILGNVEDLLSRLTSLVRKPIEELKTEEASRYTQLYMAVTIGYAHMRFSHFPASPLRYDRDTYMKSMNEFIDRVFEAM